MAGPFLGEIMITSFGFAPKGWAKCDGQLLPINQNQALFSLLGTMYGGNGQTNFALPDLRARTPIHVGDGFNQGQNGGQQNHTLSLTEMPTHTHSAQGTTENADSSTPTGNLLGAANNAYTPPGNLTALHPSSFSNVGGSQPHDNMQPYLALNFCMALQGVFPSRSS
jgi:microcystin-dependent protein